MFRKLRRRLADMRALTELMTSAERLARADGLDRPGSEHVVAAAINHPDGRAAAMLAPHGVDAERFLEAIRRVHARALDEVGIHPGDDLDAELPAASAGTGAFRAEPSAQDLLQRVAANAEGFDSAAFVREAAEVRHGTVALVFEELGLAGAAFEC